jgi:hypothetical protein
MADVLGRRDRAVYGKDDQGNSAQGAEAVREVTANRRSRAAYNAYQREYMRKRRGS